MVERSIRFESVSLEFDSAAIPQRKLLKHVDAEFPSGKLCVVHGSTGVGKSTLLHLAAGLLRPTGGTIFAGDEPISRMTAPNRDKWRRAVGFLPQSPLLFDTMSVFSNVEIPLLPRGISKRKIREAVEKALGLVEMASVSNTRAGVLSGGEQQRVALARAMVSKPDYLILDEPTAHQDDGGIEILRKCVGLAKSNGAVVLATCHDPRFKKDGDIRFLLDADGFTGIEN